MSLAWLAFSFLSVLSVFGIIIAMRGVDGKDKTIMVIAEIDNWPSQVVSLRGIIGLVTWDGHYCKRPR